MKYNFFYIYQKNCPLSCMVSIRIWDRFCLCRHNSLQEGPPNYVHGGQTGDGQLSFKYMIASIIIWEMCCNWNRPKGNHLSLSHNILVFAIYIHTHSHTHIYITYKIVNIFAVLPLNASRMNSLDRLGDVGVAFNTICVSLHTFTK